ncbi:MAG TPA: hypothetical protein VLW85_12565, partial [Myxococcales bacterium]|nr:hypothetical protein [Myxococcales bacterium]
DLWLDARKVGSGVSSQSGAYAFSQRDEVAFLSAWRFRAGEGELWTASAGSEPVQVAPQARAFAWSPDGSQLAFVAPDRLGIRGRTPLPLPGLAEIAWSPDGKRLAARSSASSGGKLYVVEPLSGSLREIAAGTSDFAFAADGTLAALGPAAPKGGDRPLLVNGKEIARATAFSFAPDGREVALLSTQKQPGEAYGDLLRLKLPGGEPQPVASRVSDWRWGPAGDLLCLARYDLRARAGTLVAGGREIAAKVQGFSIFGRRILYLVQAPQKGDFKLELWGLDLASQQPPHKIDEGVYGWDLSGDTLFYKARCAGGPRACALLRVPFAGGQPETLAADVAGFDLSADGARILVEAPHRGASRAVDLSVIPSAGPPLPLPLKRFVEEVDPSARFVDAAGKRVAFAVTTPQKAGVYLADVQ